MLQEQAEDTLSRIDHAFRDDDHERALELASDLRAALLATPPTDPLLLGWARFYEYRSLYELGRYGRAYELLTTHEPVSWVVSQANAAYMFSIGSELAMHLELPDEIVRWGGRCLDLRLEAGDRVSAAQCAQTVCTLLARLAREDLNERFASYLVELGRATGAQRPTIAGWRALAENVARSHDRQLAKRLPLGLAELRAIDDDGFSEEAMSAIDLLLDSGALALGLDSDAERERKRECALMEAAGRGETSTALRLLDGGTDLNAVDRFGRTALSHAAFAGHLELVRALLARGADVHRANMQRRTPLVLAADQGHAKIVAALVEAGSDVDHRGIFDQTALILACWQGHVETVRVLLDAGSDLSLEDCTGNSALTLTATEPQAEVVQLLLERGAVVDAANEEEQMGQTALIKAAMHGRDEVLEVLLAHGADRRRRDRNGMTAADWADEEGFRSVARRLRAA